jgi:hypothetical protein
MSPAKNLSLVLHGVTGNNSSPVSLPTGMAGINLLSLKIASVNDTSHKFIVGVVDTGKH